VLLGTVVTPLPRRRPQIVARQVVTLDHLSGGRAVLGVGIGEDFEYEAYGESVHARGARLDEGLEVVTRLLSVDKCGSCTPSTDGSRRIHVVRKAQQFADVRCFGLNEAWDLPTALRHEMLLQHAHAGGKEADR
jgi:alkanesulfonate monooxygenase SsuD/methylene tetrahydromethanopterin reductase-like flavin-dependent oxidoreductase (luciferase family)